MTRLLIVLAILAWPLAEIAGFVVVGSQIGVLATIGLVLVSGIVGSLLLRWQGLGLLARIRQELDAGRNPSRELAHGAMIVVAAILLMLPGFITDIVGLLLFIPPVRDLGWRFLRNRIRVVSSVKGFGPPGSGRRGPTIDLDEDDYSAGPRPDTPWRRIDEP